MALADAKIAKFTNRNYKRRINFLLFLAIIISMIWGSCYIYITWKDYVKQAETHAINLAESAEAFLPVDLIKNLEANKNDLSKPEYLKIKNSLIKYKKNNDDNIAFAYLLVKRDGKLYFLVDSEAPDSEGYSPPGQAYVEATSTDLQPFLDGKAVVTSPTTDRWGTWVSTLIPIKDPKTGEVIAEFGADYPARQWNLEIYGQVLQAVLIVLCLLLILISYSRVLLKNIKLKIVSTQLKNSESLFRTVFEQAPIGIAIVKGFQFLSKMNPMYEKILNRSKESLNSVDWANITHPDDLHEDLQLFSKFRSGKIHSYSMMKRFIKPDGSYVWVKMLVAPLNLENGSDTHLCLIEDISDRKNTEEALYESERSKGVLLSHLPGMAYRCNYNPERTLLFISEGCFTLTGYKSEDLLYKRDLSFSNLICPEYKDALWNEWTRIVRVKGSFKYEYEIITQSGERKWVLELGQGIYDQDDTVEALEGIIIDITESKQHQSKVQYINDHDVMTGLNNRRFYEETKSVLDTEEHLPLSIIIGDINGVRMINDAFGHMAGDALIKATAEMIQSCCRNQDILARTGGDEFSILLPNTSTEEASGIIKAIATACKVYNSTQTNTENYINLSLGFATKHTMEQDIVDIEKEAEDSMYKSKLLERKSYHNAMIASIMTTLYVRSQETENHAERLGALTKMVGEKLNLPQKSLDDLQLLSMLHDIGKVGIDDRILNKPGKLTADEWTIMKTHSELGYRIAMSSPELEHIAESILAHHERYDGNGYPRGLKGEQIPLLSRILAVADAYDAMTEDRVYRKALSKEKAINELKKHAGSQFDPAIAQIFINSI